MLQMLELQVMQFLILVFHREIKEIEAIEDIQAKKEIKVILVIMDQMVQMGRQEFLRL